jgi:hypothetical protein
MIPTQIKKYTNQSWKFPFYVMTQQMWPKAALEVLERCRPGKVRDIKKDQYKTWRMLHTRTRDKVEKAKNEHVRWEMIRGKIRRIFKNSPFNKLRYENFL